MTEKVHPIVEFKGELEKRSGDFKAALPAHIPAERFIRTTVTAIQNSPDILECTKASILTSCMKAAQDGLVLDGREAALVKYNVKEGDKWVAKAQYMPMIAGVMKLVRNSGQLSSLTAQVVYSGDKFSYNPASGEAPNHEPDWFGKRGTVIGVYAVARLKDGSVVVEVMSRDDVEAIRARSKGKDKGPWVTDWNEMARKTVIRRISKYLPKSTDRDDDARLFSAIERHDEDFDFEAEAEPATAPKQKRKRAAEILSGATVEVNPETGEIIDALGSVTEPTDSDVM